MTPLDGRGLTRWTGRTPPGGVATVADALEAGLAAAPGRDALVGRFKRFTYAELDREANRAAHAMMRRGIGPGDRVAASLPNHPDIVVAFLGAMRLGAVWVGVNPVLAPKEKAYLLADAGASVLLAEARTADELAPLREGLPALAEVVEVAPHGGCMWGDLLASGGTARPTVAIDPSAPAAIGYTSGTTGWPKGAVHSQHNLLVVGAANRAWGGWRAVPRQAALLPLSTLNVIVIGPLLVFQLAGTCICVDRTDPLVIADWVEREQVQSFSSVPTVIHDLVTTPGVHTEQLRSLTHVGTGGATVPAPIAERFRARFGAEMLVGYGLTEAPSVVTCQVAGKPHPQGDCGRALPHVVITIRDEDGRVLGPGETGEVCVAGAPDSPLAGSTPRSSATGAGRMPPRQRYAGACCTPGTSGRSTPPARSSSRAATTTWSSAVVRTCTRPRSSECCSPSRRWPGRRSSAPPMSGSANASWPSCSWRRAPRRPRRSCNATASVSSPATRYPMRCGSSTCSRSARPARS